MKAFIIVFAIAMLSVASARRGKPEFHWRDFNGTIPRDAFKVYPKGSDEPVYVGQGYYKGVGLLPGLLRAGEEKMSVVAKNSVVTIQHNIMIMCTDSIYQESDFQWIQINYNHLNNIRALSFLNVPQGGVDTGSDVYIGRHSESDFINIGKITTAGPYKGLVTSNSKNVPIIHKNFELLALLNFDCNEEDGQSNSEESNEDSHEMRSPTRHSSRHYSSRH